MGYSEKTMSQAPTMNATLNIFSGRPNPSWTLSNQIAIEFIRKINELPATVGADASANGLGYRGIVVTNDSPSSVGITSISLYKGFVTVRFSNGNIRYLADYNRKIEVWLLDNSLQYLDSQIFALVQQELSSIDSK